MFWPFQTDQGPGWSLCLQPPPDHVLNICLHEKQGTGKGNTPLHKCKGGNSHSFDREVGLDLCCVGPSGSGNVEMQPKNP